MADTWPERLAAVGQNLLSMEVNTLVTTGLSAQKMPEIPLALHAIVQVYSDYVAAADFAVTPSLLRASASRVAGTDEASTNQGANALLAELQQWPFPRRPDSPLPDDQREPPSTDLTNGAESFEALQWAAWAALQTLRAGRPLPSDPDASVLSRINSNCRQLKEAALRLEHQHPDAGQRTPQSAKAGARNRIVGVTRNPAPASNAEAADGTTAPRLFGATIEQTARALFDHPRPAITVDPDVTILIRKAWDIGVRRVCLQTVLQVDGDVLQVIGDLRPDERDFLMLMHKQAVRDSTTQWRNFFDIVVQLAEKLGKLMANA